MQDLVSATQPGSLIHFSCVGSACPTAHLAADRCFVFFFIFFTHVQVYSCHITAPVTSWLRLFTARTENYNGTDIFFCIGALFTSEVLNKYRKTFKEKAEPLRRPQYRRQILPYSVIYPAITFNQGVN